MNRTGLSRTSICEVRQLTLRPEAILVGLLELGQQDETERFAQEAAAQPLDPRGPREFGMLNSVPRPPMANNFGLDEAEGELHLRVGARFAGTTDGR